jgi:cell division septal protein FtsQ
MPEYMKPKKKSRKAKDTRPSPSVKDRVSQPQGREILVSKTRQEMNKKAQQEFRRSKEMRNSRKRPAKKRSGNRILYYLAATIFLMAVCTVLSVTVLFNVTDITVSGDSRYSEDEIIQASGVEYGANLIRMNASEIEVRILNALVYLDEVKVIKHLPSGLELFVSGAVPALSVQHDDLYYLVSSNGRVLEETTANMNTVSNVHTILVTGLTLDGDQSVGEPLALEDETKLKALFEVFHALEQDSFTGIRSINISDKLNIILNYEDRIELQLGDTTNLREKLYVAKTLIEKEIEVNQKVILMLSNPRQVVRRLVYDDLSPTVTSSESSSKTDTPEEPSVQNP